MQTFGTDGGKLVTILGVYEESQKLRPDVTIIRTSLMFWKRFEWPYYLHYASLGTLIYTSLGKPLLYRGTPFPASTEDRGHMAQFLKKVPELVKSGQIKPNPTKLVDGGIEGINAGLKLMMDGKHSGEKIVYRVSN